jgi:uncharacterized protein YxeA
MKKIILSLIAVVALLVAAFYAFNAYIYNEKQAPASNAVVESKTDVAQEAPVLEAIEFTERYAAQVDRVAVVFEHKDYTRYRLTTNGLVREGELNTERGFEDDIDATVYVLNWQQPEGEQMFYVRLTAEPDRLYALDGERKILRGSALILEP